MVLLNLVGVLLTEWLLIAAEISSDVQYYFWAFLAAMLWAQAVHNRNPRLYPRLSGRLMYFGLIFAMLFLLNKSVIFLREFELGLPPG
ncbi:MAG: hypothetical protein OEV06_04600 [Anaerolineae bacterium]|nr:hypothetical protein [Anaerolineae bacterium]